MPYVDIRSSRYFYTEMGEGSPTLVFAHGFLLDSDMFRYQLEEFGTSHRVIAFDWRGQGRSEVAHCGYEIKELYRDAVELLHFWGCDKDPCVWVGVSMGGFVGMRLGARNPKLLKGLVLADTGADSEVVSKKILWSLMTLFFYIFGPSLLANSLKRILFAESSLRKPFVREYEEKWRSWSKDPMKKEALVKTAWSIFNRPSFTGELTKVRVPTLVVVGQEDKARPYEEALKLYETIPGSRLVVIPKAGHSSPLENPGEFNRHLREFLRDLR
ncbi:MAG: alpha/beta hydrolase [Thermotogae bacterium]|nr:alpha/beta hydrolase [Thermotogota bacterium]